jgi:hypothetical protein
MATPDWSAEKISAMETDKIRNLMNNALNGERDDIADLCEEVLLSRTKNNKPVLRASEFHFVCDPQRQLTENDNGTFWSGYWPLAKGHFANSVNFNSVVALHRPDKSPSFMRGKITRWEESAEGTVRFLARNTESPLNWTGDGQGPKGLKWIAVR